MPWQIDINAFHVFNPLKVRFFIVSHFSDSTKDDLLEISTTENKVYSCWKAESFLPMAFPKFFNRPKLDIKGREKHLFISTR